MIHPTPSLLLLLSLCLLLPLAHPASITQIFLSNNIINQPSTYSWTINFINATDRTNVNLTFPAVCTLNHLANSTASIGGTTLNFTVVGNVVIITGSTLLKNTVTIDVTNIKNPDSALKTNSFTAFTTLDSTILLPTTSQVTYKQATMASCSWSFSACTEQPNSNLTISATLTNNITTGTKQFIVGIAKWPQHNNKTMLTGVTAVSAFVSFDSGVTYTQAISSPINSNNDTITITYNQTIQFNTSNTLWFIITGVNSPPTKATTLTTLYDVATADSSGNLIDFSNAITVADTCVYNYTGGAFVDLNMPVNSLYYGPQIDYSQYFNITMQASDTVELYFSPLTNFISCSSLTIWRNFATSMQATLNASAPTSSFYQFVIPAANSEFDYTLTIRPGCSSIRIPTSETPKDVTFLFKRGGSAYFQLTTAMYPTATAIATANASLVPSSTEMTASPVQYTFSITTAQNLGANPMLKLTNFPSTATVPASPGCSITLSIGTPLNSNCTYNSTTRNLTVLLTASTSTVAAGTVITITVPGITNAPAPTTHILGAETYYDSSVSSSRVEYSTSAFGLTYTGVTSFAAVLTPASMTVYTVLDVVITLTTTIAIPSASSIYIQFPAQATELTISTNPLIINGTAIAVTINNHNNNSYTISCPLSIATDSIIAVTTSVRSPSSLGDYSGVIISISKGSTLYLQSSGVMSMLVNSVSNLPTTITSLNSIAGASSGYNITVTLSVPHDPTFTVTVALPSDITFTSSGSTCTNDCLTTVTPQGTGFKFTAVNSATGTGHNLTFTLSSTFTNPRAKGVAGLWTITTATVASGSTVTVSQAAPTISSPNKLTASMLADNYYINSSKVVKMSFTFINELVSTDYLLWTAPTTTYSQLSTINCSAVFGTCIKQTALSTANTLVVSIQPNINAIINGTLTVTLQGLLSGSDSTNNISVSSYNSSAFTFMMDSGVLVYSISCIDSALSSVPNNCKTCHSNGSCIDCQTTYGFYLNGTVCVSDCGLATSYYSYNGSSGACVSCTNNCFTCYSQTQCIICQSNYYYFSNQTCLSTCPAAGYVSATVGTNLYCYQCYGDGLCLTCSSNAPGACTLCVNTSILSTSGICSTSCGNSTMYASGGFCYNCDVSCSTCTSGGNGGCIGCALGYYNYSGFCVSSCPNDTVANSAGLCTCDLPCIKCSGTTVYCTACNVSTEFAYQGQCISSCPSQSYASGATCVACSSGCDNCSSTTCFSCLANYYSYNNLCYSDCNLISRQFDVSGTKCVQCPDGCDTCSGTICSSCLSDYTYSSSTQQCIQTCLLTSSCATTSQSVLPLPGLISVLLWTIIVVVIKLLLHKNYLPYSLILFNGVVQFVLVIAVLANATEITEYIVNRLLASPSNSERLAIRALMGVSIAVNYLTNIAYILIFVKYIKPLMQNPRQIDFISNIVVLVIGSLTNYRLALMAFAKLFPKPYIHIRNPSKLTPVHYLTIASIILDLLPLVACGIAIHNQPSGSTLFMLSVDLLIIIALNIIVTIWFVACSKPEEYYADDIKKYHLEEQHNATHDTIGNDKDVSKTNMVANDTFNCTDQEVVSNNFSSYKRLEYGVSKRNNNIKQSQINIVTDQDKISSGQQYHVIPIRGAKKTSSVYDPYSDPNYEVSLKPKNSGRVEVKPTRDVASTGRRKVANNNEDQDMPANKAKESPVNFSKKTQMMSPKAIHQQNQLQQDLPDLPQESQQQRRKSVFENPRDKLPRPKRTNDRRHPHQKSSPIKGTKNQLGKSPEPIEKGPMKKSGKVGYFQSDAFESNVEEDIESIIKQKVHLSAIKKPKEGKEFISESNNSEVGNEQISPSWFNIQNQRIELSDFDQNSET